jgi:hypothetical protein
MSGIKLVSNRTLIKKITVGTPIFTTKRVQIRASLSDIVDVDVDETESTDPAVLAGANGHVLVYDATEQKYVSQELDGGNTF